MNEEDRLQALNSLLARCRKSSFYSGRIPDRVLTSLDQLKELPFTTKDDIRNNSPFGFVSVPKSELYEYHESFGTTGTPASSWFTREDMECFAKGLSDSGIDFTDEDTVLVRFPYAISVIAHFMHLAAHMKNACVIPASSRNTISPFKRIIDLMRKLHVTVLAGLPMQTILIAETAEMLGMNPRSDFPGLRAIFTAGELLTPRKRKLIERLWGVPVVDNYGMTEIGVTTVDCKYGVSHPFEENFLFEVLDDQFTHEVEAGEIGNLVVTTLSRKASPLVRYITGDRARWAHQDCPCGRHSSLEVRGRIQDVIMIGDKKFDLWELDQMLSCLSFGRFWIAAPTEDGIQFQIEQELPEDQVGPGQLEALEKKYRIKISMDVVPKGMLYDRSELLSVGVVGKPRYIYSEDEIKNKGYLQMDRN